MRCGGLCVALPSAPSVRRGALLAALLVALAAAGDARAQAIGARPAVGGGSFNDAPLLTPGRYRDTLRPGERLYYAFALQAGQRLRIGAQIPGDGEHVRGNSFEVGVATPLRDVENDPFTEDFTGHGEVVFQTGQPIDVLTGPTLTFAAADAAPLDGNYEGPGVWFATFTLRSVKEVPPPVEQPLEFSVAVEGRPQPEPRPSPTPATTATPTPASGGGGDGGVGALVLAGLAGVLVGLALAVGSGVRIARRRTA